MRSTTMTRPLVGALAVTAAVSSLLLVPGAAHGTTAAAQPGVTYFGGQAFGSIVSVSSLAASGKTAYVPMCTSQLNTKHTNKTAALTVPGLGTIGAVTTRIASAGHHTGVSSTSTSRTAGTSLLAGVIHADVVTSTARVFKSKSGAYTSTASSSLLNLSIAGQKLPSTTTPNQAFSLPGLGSVVLDQIVRTHHNGLYQIKVNALRLHLNPANTLGLPSGIVTIGHSAASMHEPVVHQAFGSAYGTTAEVLDVVKSSRTAVVSMGCGGAGGTTIANQTAGVKIPSVLQTGVTGSTTGDTVHGTRMVTTSRSRIAHVNLLGGALQADVIEARAKVTRNGSHLTRSSAGTTLLGLTINGQSFAAPSTDMTETIPGLATLYFNHVDNIRGGMKVYALRVVLLTAVGGLAQGAQITLGAAEAGVKP